MFTLLRSREGETQVTVRGTYRTYNDTRYIFMGRGGNRNDSGQLILQLHFTLSFYEKFAA